MPSALGFALPTSTLGSPPLGRSVCHTPGRSCKTLKPSNLQPSLGLVAAVPVATVARRCQRLRRQRRLRLWRLASSASSPSTGEELATLQEKEDLERAITATAERLAELQPSLSRATAFQLEGREELQREVDALQQRLAELEQRLAEVKARLPAAEKPSVFVAAKVQELPPLSKEEEAATDAALRKLDTLLRRVIDAEVAGESTRTRSDLESKVQELLNSDLSRSLRGFGSAEAQVEKRLYTLQEMKDNGVDAAQLLSPKDSTLDNIRKVLLALLALGGAAAILALKPSTGSVVFVTFSGLFVLFLDQVVNRGFGELLLLDTLSRVGGAEYATRVAEHEAGHFLVAYLVGILPKAYTMSAWEAFSKYNSMSTQAGTTFFDGAIQQEVQAGKISGKTLDSFVSVALGGLVAEYLIYGQANGGGSDIQQLESLFEALKFDQQRTSVQLRSSVLNTLGLLKQHRGAHRELAKAMAAGASVGECIQVIERSLGSKE